MYRASIKSFRGVLGVGVLLLGLSGVAQAADLKHDDLDAAIKAESAAIQGTVQTESMGIKTEMSAQHDMIKQDLSDAQTAIQADLAEVKALVEALEPGPAAPPCGAGTEGERFVTSGDNTEVCDNTTGLSWVKMPDLTKRNHAAAITHCAGLDLGNGQTYRLPEVKEFISLVDYSQSNPALPPGHPFMNVQVLAYWTPATRATNPANAWYVNFGNGDVNTFIKTGNLFVWCARSGS